MVLGFLVQLQIFGQLYLIKLGFIIAVGLLVLYVTLDISQVFDRIFSTLLFLKDSSVMEFQTGFGPYYVVSR